jgi:hypothetical protein
LGPLGGYVTPKKSDGAKGNLNARLGFASGRFRSHMPLPSIFTCSLRCNSCSHIMGIRTRIEGSISSNTS